MLLKFRWAGPRGGSLFIDPQFIEIDPDGPVSDHGGGDLAVTSWASEVAVGLYWDVDGTTYVELYNAFFDGTGILPSVQADPGSLIDDGITYFEVFEPWSHYWFRDAPAYDGAWENLQPDVDYYLRISFGMTIHDATAHSRTISIKYWLVDGVEPSGWVIEDVMPMYKAGADTHLGFANNTGWITGGFTGRTEFSLGPTAASGGWTGIDAVWVYGGGTIVTTPGEIPTFDGTGNEEASLYVTRLPYMPGTLVVHFEGIRLRLGIDYIETDPSSGQFRILGDRDISTGLSVTYVRAGTEAGTSGGEVYRPAPILQYGWGTPLDGYNSVMACSAMALDRHTQGAYTAYVGDPRSTPPIHRSFQPDQSGPVDLDAVTTAWSAGWSQTLYNPGVSSFAFFESKVGEGRGAILQGSYALLPASKRFSSFTGAHALFINERFENGNYLGYDPLYRYPVIYTTAELESYASGLLSTGVGLVSAAFTGVTS